MGQFAINGHRSKVPLSTWGVLELHQNSFLGSSWDLYGAIKSTGPSRSGKFSLNRHSGLRKVLSSRPESGPNVECILYTSIFILWHFRVHEVITLPFLIGEGHHRAGYIALI